MKASELILELQRMIYEHGDVSVTTHDVDGWVSEIEEIYYYDLEKYYSTSKGLIEDKIIDIS